MAHKITRFDTVISNEGTEWHKLAKHVENIPLGDILRVWGEAELEPCEHNGQAIPDTRAVLVNGRPIATVGNNYTAVSTATVVNAVEAIMELGDRYKITTVGTVDNQRDAFVCISLGRSISIGRNDRIAPYFTIIDNRTGARKVMIGQNATRPVCANTVTVARRQLNTGDSSKHHSGVDAFVRSAVEAFRDQLQQIEAFEDDVNKLVETTWDKATMTEFLESFAPAKPKPDAKRKSQGHDNAMRAMRGRIYRESAETGISRDSAWLGYNAVTGALQHDMTIKGDKLAARIVGSTATKTESAWNAALALC